MYMDIVSIIIQNGKWIFLYYVLEYSGFQWSRVNAFTNLIYPVSFDNTWVSVITGVNGSSIRTSTTTEVYNITNSQLSTWNRSNGENFAMLTYFVLLGWWKAIPVAWMSWYSRF